MADIKIWKEANYVFRFYNMKLYWQ